MSAVFRYSALHPFTHLSGNPEVTFPHQSCFNLKAKHSEMEISEQTDLAAPQSWHEEQRQPSRDMAWQLGVVCVCWGGAADWWD